jgi:hypothetical protein
LPLASSKFFGFLDLSCFRFRIEVFALGFSDTG